MSDVNSRLICWSSVFLLTVDCAPFDYNIIGMELPSSWAFLQTCYQWDGCLFPHLLSLKGLLFFLHCMLSEFRIDQLQPDRIWQLYVWTPLLFNMQLEPKDSFHTNIHDKGRSLCFISLLSSYILTSGSLLPLSICKDYSRQHEIIGIAITGVFLDDKSLVRISMLKYSNLI